MNRDKPSFLYLSALPLELGAVGIATHTRDLIRGLAESSWRHRCCLLAPPWLANDGTLLASKLRVQIIGIPKGTPKALRGVWWCQRAASEVRRCRGAVLHSPAIFPSWNLPDAAFFTCHDVIPFHYPVYLGRLLYRRLLFRAGLRTLRHAKGVITVSEFSAGEIQRFCRIPRNRIHVIANCVAPEFEPGLARSGVGRVSKALELPRRYWVYVGGYDVRKNVEMLIHAYSEACGELPDPPALVLAGRIPNRLHPTLCDVRGSLAGHSFGKGRVVCPGYIEPVDLPAVYAGAELLVFPSQMEGFGYPALEAMSCGCPAIVADNSSLPEVVTEPGYRFAADRPVELARMLVRAGRSPFPLNPGFERERFTRRRMVEKHLEVFGLKVA